MDNVVTVKINSLNFIVGIENNNEVPGYKKADIKIGQRLPKSLLALFLMNPHRFNIQRVNESETDDCFDCGCQFTQVDGTLSLLCDNCRN